MKRYSCVSLFLLTALILLLSNCLSQADSYKDVHDINGFYADPNSYVIGNHRGKKNVIKVNGAKADWAVVRYSLEEYKGKEITIEFSVDVRREGAVDNFNWQINNTPIYPSITYLLDAQTSVWHNMKGRIIVTPTNDKPFLYLTTWENKANNTVYYVANPTIKITEGSLLSPDLSLTPLKAIYKDHFLIGNITDDTYMKGRYLDNLLHHYNSVTCTATYPIQMSPLKKGDPYRWDYTDRIVNQMISNNIPVHGHILVWHEATPAWITTGTRREVEQNLINYVTAVMTHFKGRIMTWDVINEAIADNLSNYDAAGDWRRNVRKTESWMPNPWFDKLGPDYIEIAFRAARAADPDVTLYYNDYGLENPNKAEVTRKMILDINDRYKKETGGSRNLIEGVGSQAHIFNMKLNIDEARVALEKLISLGIDIAISELDISTNEFDRGYGKDTEMSEKVAIAQAIQYAKLFKLYRDNSAHISRVTMWGMDDGTSWISSGNPCLFDWKLNAKKAFHAISDPDGFLAKYDR